MVTEIVGQILVLGGLTLAGLLLNRLLRLELTLACLLVGFLAGLCLEFVDFDTGIRAFNLQEIVFFIILPVLIFEAAWHLSPTTLKAWAVPVLLLATVGVVIGAFVTAGLVYLGISHPQGFPWIAALLTGAILAATDPISVMSQLRASNAPEDLAALFEGESLFNDASSVVLFTIVVAIATQMGHGAESSYLGFFAMVFVGGIVFGLLSGLLATGIALLMGSPVVSRFILVFSAFASFYVAEHVLQVSGIMAVMMTALTTKFLLNEVENTVAQGIADTWEWLGLFLNNLLFVLMGLVITLDMFTERWLAMIIAIAAMLVARTLAVTGVSTFSRLLGKPVPGGWQVLLIWGGLRGAVAIALVLSLPTSLPYWWTIQSMVFGVVVFSLLVQGTTNKYLVRRVVADTKA